MNLIYVFLYIVSATDIKIIEDQISFINGIIRCGTSNSIRPKKIGDKHWIRIIKDNGYIKTIYLEVSLNILLLVQINRPF